MDSKGTIGLHDGFGARIAKFVGGTQITRGINLCTFVTAACMLLYRVGWRSLAQSTSKPRRSQSTYRRLMLIRKQGSSNKQCSWYASLLVIKTCMWTDEPCRNRSVIDLYSALFDVGTIATPSENQLTISYGGKRPYALSLIFHPATHRLRSAKVCLRKYHVTLCSIDGIQILDSNADITHLAAIAIEADDVPGLVRDVRALMSEIV
jgi:hypothetical protein